MTLPSQSTSVPLRLVGFLTEDNLAGDDLSVLGATDFVGGSEAVEVDEGDYVMGLVVQGGGVTGTVYKVVDGFPWVAISRQPIDEPGWIIAVVGSDLQFQSGMCGYFNSAGLFIPVGSGRFVILEATVQGIIDSLE